jgi:trehalose 6-phosphate phosphatase
VTRTQPILDPAHQQTLAGFALSNVLLAFDYDGTLAPIAPRPEDAHMRPITRSLLAAVAQAYPTVVISGRALADVTAMLHSVPLWYVYGNHGLEPRAPHSEASTDTRSWVALLEARLPRELGIRIEDKAHTLTLHFRGVSNPTRALAAIEAAVEALPDVSVLRGKEAINLLPRGSGNKGAALQQALATFACQNAIFVGDEDTDESAFAAGPSTLGIRVESSEASMAGYHLGSQAEIDALLRRLLDLRSGPSGDRRGGP